MPCFTVPTNPEASSCPPAAVWQHSRIPFPRSIGFLYRGRPFLTEPLPRPRPGGAGRVEAATQPSPFPVHPSRLRNDSLHGQRARAAPLVRRPPVTHAAIAAARRTRHAAFQPDRLRPACKRCRLIARAARLRKSYKPRGFASGTHRPHRSNFSPRPVSIPFFRLLPVCCM